MSEDTQREGFFDRSIKADEQLPEALSTAAHEHGIGTVFVGSRGDTTNGVSRPTVISPSSINSAMFGSE